MKVVFVSKIASIVPSIFVFYLTNGGNAYQDRNAIINPKVEKKNVLPCGSKGLRMGID